MSEIRAQGRPVRGVGEVGRARIVEGTRAFLRSVRDLDWSRKNIAEYIGVTPALISYYFPERAELFEAATTPVINDYIAAVDALETSEKGADARLRALTGLFVRCHTTDHNVFEAFKAVVLRSEIYAGPDLTIALLERARSLLSGGFCGDEYTTFEASFIVNALWGIAKFDAERAADDAARGFRVEQPGDFNESDKIYTLITNGVRYRRPSCGVELQAPQVRKRRVVVS